VLDETDGGPRSMRRIARNLSITRWGATLVARKALHKMMVRLRAIDPALADEFAAYVARLRR
jgi:hypothetical protein